GEVRRTGQGLVRPGTQEHATREPLIRRAMLAEVPLAGLSFEEDIGAVVGLVIISVATFGGGDVVIAGAVAEEATAEAAAEATAEVTAEAAAGEAAVDGGGEAVTENILTDSFVQEVYEPGEYALMDDDFSAIDVEADGGSLSSLVSADGLGADVEVWTEGEWTSFESEVAIDVDAGAEPAIFDDYFYADAAGAVEADVEADAEADAQRAVDRAVAQAFAGFGFF
ncbi:MAG: hypothetical protein RLZZ440_772, partial [Planctomycetota bacterium]